MDGRYEILLMWKAGYKERFTSSYEMANNRFKNLIKTLKKKPNLFAAYLFATITLEQLKKGIVQGVCQIREIRDKSGKCE